MGIKIAAGVAVVLTNIAKAKQLLSNPTTAAVSLGGSLPSAKTSELPKSSNSGTGGGDYNPSRRVARPVVQSGSGSPYIPPPSTPTPIGTGSTQLDENGNAIGQTIEAYVVETKITNVQNRVSAIKKRNSFG